MILMSLHLGAIGPSADETAGGGMVRTRWTGRRFSTTSGSGASH